MAKKTDERRDALRNLLTDLAEEAVRTDGMSSLRARSLASKAGCAVGAIYNVFDDMTGLVMAVNGRTFQSLGAHVSEAVARQDNPTPTDTLVTMAKAYLQFAVENPNLWRALFEVEMSVDKKVPDWYLAELGRLFSLISRPLKEIYPDASESEVDLRTRALFSSIHGIVLLGTERRISGVPTEQLETMIEFLLLNVTSPTNN